MSRQYFRLLGDSANSSPATETSDSDFVIILAALLCALICILGLVSIARCACCFRRSSSSPNKGLKKKILRSLPKQTFTPSASPKFSDCAICLAEFTAGEEIRVLPHCDHSFHVACIDTWLGSHSSCPSCRNILVCHKCTDAGSKQGSCPIP